MNTSFAIGLVLHVLVVAGVSARVIWRRRPPGVSLAWLVLVLTLPYVGAGFYLLFGERPLGRRRGERAAALRAPMEAWTRHLSAAAAKAPPPSNAQWRAVRALADQVAPLSALSGNELALFDASEATLRAIIADIDAATQYCLLEFYIWSEGGTADEVGRALMRAAGRGVACRVLVDAVGSKPFLKGAWPARLRQAGVQVVAALPAGILRVLFARIDLRLHRKLVVVDGRVAYTGSLNLVDPRFFKQDADVGEWVDAMARVEGPVVAALIGLFAWDWALETGDRLDEVVPGLTEPPPLPAGDAVVQVVPSGPAYEEDGVLQLLVAAVYAAEHELTLTTPYFVPDDRLMDALTVSARRGVRVRLVVPARIDSALVRHASRSYYQDLLDAGVEVHCFEDGLLHTKSVLIDGTLAFFGTLNLDMRSFRLNFELTLVVYDAAFGAKLKALQERYVARSARLVRAAWSARPPSRRFLENAVQLLSPLL